MSAQIPDTMLLSDLLKPTGFDCPEDFQGKTFAEATAGGDVKVSTNTDAEIDVSAYTEPVVVEPAEGYDATKKVTVELKNIPSGADLESNHAATINVSSYTEPVEIEPTAGKDGMEKVTVTLDNIPSGQVSAYCWGNNDVKVYMDFSSAPDSAPSEDYPVLRANDGLIEKTTWGNFGFDDYTYEKVDDSTIKLTLIDDPTDVLTFTRFSVNDFVLWG